MKMLYLALCIFPQLCLAVDQGQLNAMLLIAGKAQSNQYIEARQKILSLGANIEPLLLESGTNDKLTWQQRLVARICYERSKKGEEIAAFRRYDWRKHPQYNKKWEENIIGPIFYLNKIAVSKCEDMGFWYYYVEMNWKNTGEFAVDSIIPRINDSRSFPASWIGWCTMALQDKPENYYLIRALMDQLDIDPELQSPRSVWCYSYLADLKSHAPRPAPAVSVPLLIRYHDIYCARTVLSGRNAREREDYYSGIFEIIMSSANISQAELIEEYINSHPRLLNLKNKLDDVRKRPVPQLDTDPPFRLGQQLVAP